MTPQEEMERALAARTYEDGLVDGQLEAFYRVGRDLAALERAIGEALWNVARSVEQLKGQG